MARKPSAATVDRLLSAGLTTAALVMAVSFSHREFSGARRTAEPTEHYEDWREWLDHATLVGDSSAPVTIVEFNDMECVGCKAFHERVLHPVRAEFGPSVALAIVPFPLRSHRFAMAAAEAAECATAQGRFEEFTDLVFEKQDSLGSKPWASFAMDAGVQDLDRYSECLESERTRTRITASRAFGDSLGVRATPTIVVNGWRYPTPPTVKELTEAIEKALSGRAIGR